METIKIIDLYNLIANEEFDKLPKKIKYEDDIYYWHEEDLDYFTDDKHNFKVYLFNNHTNIILNYEVEILEKEKKMPEKLNIEQESIGSYYIKNEYGTKCYLTKHSKIFADKINEILDYLENKDE